MTNKVALVTGAARGIGRGIANSLAKHQWSIVINYRSNVEAAKETLHMVEYSGGRGIVVQADVANLADHQRLVDETLQHFGRIDMLVNNAGMAPRVRMDILDTTEASYDEVMATNLKGPFFLTQRVARLMRDSILQVPIPKIVNIGSLSSYASSVNRAEYCISKAGISMMTTLYADRLAEYGINVYEIRPGIIATDMTSAVQEKYDKLIDEGLTPIRRWGYPDDVGCAVLAIAEDLLPFSTGEVINVDGGFHMRRL
ncbi:MAG: 3-ketoacyl-ACP reductase [Chloroflexi bacterium]|nr:3-ketoacyl-ACP reductase [Chloroflexota bacterium]